MRTRVLWVGRRHCEVSKAPSATWHFIVSSHAEMLRVSLGVSATRTRAISPLHPKCWVFMQTGHGARMWLSQAVHELTCDPTHQSTRGNQDLGRQWAVYSTSYACIPYLAGQAHNSSPNPAPFPPAPLRAGEPVPAGPTPTLRDGLPVTGLPPPTLSGLPSLPLGRLTLKAASTPPLTGLPFAPPLAASALARAIGDACLLLRSEFA